MIRSVELCDEIRCKNDFDWLFVTTNLDPVVYYGMVFDYSILDYVSTMFVIEGICWSLVYLVKALVISVIS